MPTAAYAGSPVLLEPDGTADFGPAPPAPGDRVFLVSDAVAAEKKMTMVLWQNTAIVALVPTTFGSGAADSRFTVRIEAQGAEFEATGVWVMGPPGSGFSPNPPTHHLEQPAPA